MRIAVYTRQQTQYLVKVRKTRIPRQIIFGRLEDHCHLLFITEKKRPNNSIYVDHQLFFQLKNSADVYAMIEGVYNRHRR